MIRMVAFPSGTMPISRPVGKQPLRLAKAVRKCSQWTSKEKCRQVMRQRIVTLGEVAPFCPSVDLFVELLGRQPYGRVGKSLRGLGFGRRN
jgi:hypothetical protein